MKKNSFAKQTGVIATDVDSKYWIKDDVSDIKKDIEKLKKRRGVKIQIKSGNEEVKIVL